MVLGGRELKGYSMATSVKYFKSLVLVSLNLVLLVTGTFGADLSYDLNEQQPAGTPVGSVGDDYDLRSIMTAEEYANLQYQILASGNEFAHFFGIVNNTGELYTSDPIDRDNIVHCKRASECVISLSIGVATIGSFFRRIDVDVNVKDLNDNSPAFPSPVATVQFSENSAELESTSIAGAQDKDAGNYTVVNYYIDTQNVPFTVEMEKFVDGSSLVNIIVTGKLNREDTDFYLLKIVAEDGGSPRKTGTIDVSVYIVDVNDNAPEFEKPLYNVTLKEDTQINTVFQTVTAKDPDLGDNGEVHYNLSPFNTEAVLKLFAINSTTGELSVIGQLVYIPNEQIVIYVDAFDKGDQPRSSRGVVYVNIKDSSNNPPSINVNILQVDGNARISEYANVGAPVAHIEVTDDDTDRNGKVECIAVSDSFGLERYENKEYKAVVTKTLNREIDSSHEVTIVCKDSGSPPLNTTASFTVIVLDENDNKPRFSEAIYYPKMEENNQVGAIVASVSADDIDIGNNAKIEYSLKDDAGFPFWIDPDNGEIRANFLLDREDVTHVSLIVQAEDKGQPRLSSTSTVILTILDQNDNTPEFSQPNYEFFVYENLPYNTSVDQLTATDPDNGANRSIVFSFGGQVPSSFPFTLYSDGNIKVIRSLDRELQGEYKFIVIAADQGTPPLSSSVTVTVNVLDQNDNVPIFVFPDDVNNTASIPLSSDPDAVSIQITAKDKDAGANGEISYAIIDTNLTNLFYIESANGVGTVRLHRLPDATEVLKYTIRLKAEDNGSPRKYAIKSLTVSFTKIVPPEESRQNLLIAITLGCVTVVLSIAIVLTIYLIRRNDYRRRKAEEATYSDKADLQIVPSDIKHPGDLASTSSSGSKDSLKKVSFSTDHNSSMDTEVHRELSQTPLVNLDNIKMMENGRVPPNATSSPRSFSSNQNEDDLHRLDPATVLQIHRSLLQSHDQLWPNHRDGHTPPLTKDILSQHEDNGSESSGETATYDSGRGGSESDIQTSMSQSHDNDHIKTVTFANKPKLHHFTKDNHWQNARDYPYNGHPYNQNHVPTHFNKPILPTRDYLSNPKSPSHTNPHHSQQYQNYPKYGNKLSPINDSASHMTSYDDDDETTTSGSYTIDNDHDWMNDSQPRPYFLSHNEAYC